MIVANLKQFLMPMGTTFRAGTSQGAKNSQAGFVQLLNHTKENLGRAYSRLRMTHASRDHWKDATASLHQTILGTRRDGIYRKAPMPKANTSPECVYIG
jgi:hypothetical protein